MTTSRVLSAAGIAAVLTGSIVAAPSVSHAAPAFCSVGDAYSGTVITWTGGASGSHKHDWDDAANWDPATVPDAGEVDATYQTQYVCIGGGASVTIGATHNYHVAGIDIGEGAQLVVDPRGGIFTGADHTGDLVPSYVEKGSDLDLEASTLGGNATVTVAGTLDWTGHQDGIHKLAATQAGDGTTKIAKGGKLLVDGKKFGAAVLADTRSIDNTGKLTISDDGFISMVDGTSLIDESSSTLTLAGDGGIYPNQPDADASVVLAGAVVKTGKTISVVGVPTTFKGKVKPVVSDIGGGVTFASSAVPTTKLPRNATYGIGGCDATDRKICHTPVATGGSLEAAFATTSTAGPKKSAFTLGFTKAPAKIKGHKVVGQPVKVIAPTEKTTHSTRLNFYFDKSLKGVGKAKQPVFRGKHQITVCAVHGLTATNTSCVKSDKIVKGDLEIVVITIQPKATWTVA